MGGLTPKLKIKKNMTAFYVGLIIGLVFGGLFGAISVWTLIKRYRKSLGLDPDPLATGNIYFM